MSGWRTLWMASWLLLAFAAPGRAELDEDARHLLDRGRELAAAGRSTEALPFYEQALDMARVELVPTSTTLGQWVHELALVLRDAAQTERAETEMLRALSLLEPIVGDEHPELLKPLIDLADLRSRAGRPADAEPLYRRALAILDRADADRDDVERADVIGRLALVVDEQGRADEAEALYRQAIEADDGNGARSPQRSTATASSLGNLAALLVRTERQDEAESLYRRAIALRRSTLGSNHWLVAVSRADLAQLLADRGATEEALDLARQAADLLAPYCDGLATSEVMGERRSASMLCRDAQTLSSHLERQDPGPAPQAVAVVEPEPAPRPVVARSSTPRFRAQLASRNDLFEAQRTAATLKARLPGALGDLPAHIETVDLSTKGVWHRVQFGDFDERRGAVELCGLVTATGQECWVVEVREASP